MRTPRRSMPRTLVLAAVWLAGVAVATAVGFQAAHRVGVAVTDTAAAALPEHEAAASASRLGVTPVPSAGRLGLPERTGATPTRTPARPPRASTTEPETTEPDTSGSVSPTATAAGGAVTRSFPVSGGVVAVRCTGARITLLYAVPAAGYASTVTDRGPDQVEVEFSGGPDGSHVHVSCVDGRPVARVETDE